MIDITNPIRITRHNVTMIPIGTRIEIFAGCGWHMEGPQVREGIVADYVIEPNGMFPLYALVVAMQDGRDETITHLNFPGIGAKVIAEGEA